MNYNPLLLIDFYKACHHEQYPPTLTKLVSYYTPRMSRLEDTDKVVMFGLQGFINEYLMKGFNDNFFGKPEDEVVNEYKRVMDATFGSKAYDIEKIRKLHQLGYLPLEIKAVPEGRRTSIGVPQIEISNTHPDYVWLVNTIETMLSCYMWHTQISAEVGYRYRKIADKYYALTCNDNVKVERLLGDFSMRGQQSCESAMKSSAAWCLSFYNTATVPAILWLEDNYNCNCANEDVAYGAISTEHSVMCSNYAIDGDEITFIRKLLTEIYPDQNFSMVSDSYDYWNLVRNILPQLKDEILAHEGFIGIRGDSGDPVKVVCETVRELDKIFGSGRNSKGYKVLNPHVKVIYGDSITPQRCQAIYDWLWRNNYSIENVILGVGSFSMMCLEDINRDRTYYNPYTRDTFGIAVKATYAERSDGDALMIYKNPKEASFKKSQKGCCWVHPNGERFIDELPSYKADGMIPENLLKTVWKDGKFIRVYSLKRIREIMYKENK